MASAPHFILEKDKVVDLSFDSQVRVREANYAIVDVMEEKHALRVEGEIPFTVLHFPKDIYAQSVQRLRAPII